MPVRIIYGAYNAFEEALWVGSHHYSLLMARAGHRVLYLPNLKSPWHWLFKRQRENILRSKRYLRERGGLHPNLRQEFLYTLLPSYFKVPLFRSYRVAKSSVLLTIPPAARKLRKLGFDRPDLFFFENIRYLSLAERLNPRILAQRVHDNLVAFPKESALVRLFWEAVSKAEHVFVMSRLLLEEVLAPKVPKEKLHYLPNGVSSDWFNLPENLPEPQDLASIPRPRAVMVGALDWWVDFRKIYEIARILKEVSFVLIGPVLTELPGGKPDNVYFLGRRPRSQVPAYLKNSQVGISVFVKHPLTRYVNLIKLYEYMAVGLPAISVDHEELRLVEGAPWRLADSAQALAKAIAEALEEKGERKEEYIRFAKKNTWEERYKVLSRVLGI